MGNQLEDIGLELAPFTMTVLRAVTTEADFFQINAAPAAVSLHKDGITHISLLKGVFQNPSLTLIFTSGFLRKVHDNYPQVPCPKILVQEV